MPRRLAPLLLAPGVLLGACAQQMAAPPAPTALRFAQSLEQADQSVEAAVVRMDGFERLALREDAAIVYASGGNRPVPSRFNAVQAGAAEAAGRVLAPGFAALGDYAHILAQAAGGQPFSPKPSPSGAELARDAAAGLDAVRTATGTAVPEALRTAGLAGITALADLPETLSKRGGTPTLAGMVAEAQPHVLAVTALLREVIGRDAERATRGVLRTRRLGLNAAQERFLALVRADRTAGPATRYAIYRQINEMRERDPAQGTISSVYRLLEALDAAHQALATGTETPETAGRVSAFEAAATRLSSLAEASGRTD